jgi:ATP-dependent helicase/DNAse subunit B
MSLKLVLGPANSAKAGDVLGAYSAAAEAPGGALLVVPTAADARYYDRELAAGGIALGRPVTFAGLISEIARRTGYGPPRLSALHRQQLIMRAVTEQRLSALSDSASSPGFAAAAGHLFAELRAARIPPPRFAAAMRAWAAQQPPRTEYADDLARLYLRYERELEASAGVDPESFAWGALDALRAAPEDWLGTPVFVYGFDDLTAVELDAVDTLARAVGAEVTVSITYEPSRLALLARATVVEELRERAASVRELPPLDDHYAPDSRIALHHLERYLFETPPELIDPGDAVGLMEAGGQRAEAELVAGAVLEALRDGVPPSELVVICRSLARSGALLEQTLTRYGVPVVSLRSVVLTQTSLGRAVIALARCAFDPASASVADVLSYLRSPGVADGRAVDQFELKLGRWGVGDAKRALEIAAKDGLPVSVIDELASAQSPGPVLAEQVRRLLAVGARKAAPPPKAAPAREGDGATSPEGALDARAAAALLGALEQLASPSPNELLTLLPTVEIPAGAARTGAVLLAEPLAIRARRFRRVFITGMCDGAFPASDAGEPFLSDDRRFELAMASGVALPAAGDDGARERYLLYACVSRATERVTFSYRSAEEDGSVVRHSPFLDDVASLFVPAWWDRRSRRLLADVVWPLDAAPTAREYALALAAAAARPASAEAGEMRQLSAPALAHVRHTQTVSASALEKFARCPVSWLVERQLQPEQMEPTASPLAKGTLLHDLLERILRALGGPLTPASLPAAEAAVARELSTLPAEIEPGLPPAVRRAVLRGIEAELLRYLRYEAEDDCDWQPSEFEFKFQSQLGEGADAVTLTGLIDRIDVAPDGRRASVRDYKSGQLDPGWAGSKWIDGGALQVGLYMLAVRQLLALEPVAGLYQPLTGEELQPRGVFLSGTELGAHVKADDCLQDDQLEELLQEIEQQALDLVATIRSGELTPCPSECSRNGCRHPGICWA